MAAATASPCLPRTVPAGGYRASAAGTVRSEFTKIRSVRSTYWTLFLLVAAGVAWSIAYCVGEASRWPAMSAQDKVGFDPAQSSIVGLALLGQLVIVVLGTLSITARSTFGCDSVAPACVLASRAWPMKNDAKLARSATTSATAANTAALAPYNAPRRGITVSDVRIIPVEYSDVIDSVPRTTITSWPSRASPTRLDWAGSKLTLSCPDMAGHRDASPAQYAMLQAAPAATSRNMVQ